MKAQISPGTNLWCDICSVHGIGKICHHLGRSRRMRTSTAFREFRHYWRQPCKDCSSEQCVSAICSADRQHTLKRLRIRAVYADLVCVVLSGGDQRAPGNKAWLGVLTQACYVSPGVDDQWRYGCLWQGHRNESADGTRTPSFRLFCRSWG